MGFLLQCLYSGATVPLISSLSVPAERSPAPTKVIPAGNHIGDDLHLLVVRRNLIGLVHRARDVTSDQLIGTGGDVVGYDVIGSDQLIVTCCIGEPIV
jgi:hypothetical protein